MKSLKVADYMRQHPLTFKTSTTIAEAVESFLTSDQSGAPVVDDHHNLIGFLSEQDCISSMLDETYYGESHHIVKDRMRSEVLTAKEDDSIVELAERMVKDKPKIYPVVDSANKLVGIISRKQVLKAIDVHLNNARAHGDQHH